MRNLEMVIKLVLSILLFICLLDMPYGFYQLVRYAAAFGFGYLAFKSNTVKDETSVLIFIALCILFQPFFKIALGRTLWNVVDVVVGMGLILSVFKSNKTLKK